MQLSITLGIVIIVFIVLSLFVVGLTLSMTKSSEQIELSYVHVPSLTPINNEEISDDEMEFDF